MLPPWSNLSKHMKPYRGNRPRSISMRPSNFVLTASELLDIHLPSRPSDLWWLRITVARALASTISRSETFDSLETSLETSSLETGHLWTFPQKVRLPFLGNYLGNLCFGNQQSANQLIGHFLGWRRSKVTSLRMIFAASRSLPS